MQKRNDVPKRDATVARVQKRNRHVTPNRGKWGIWRIGSRRFSRNFATKQEAVAKARKLARKEKVDLYIHDKRGEIAEHISYS